MPQASDLVAYASANMPDSDSGTSGGAIDTKRRIDFTQMAANDTIEAVSTSASDTQNLTIEARKPDGTIVSETKALTGTTAISFSTLGTVERILKAELASDAVGTVTVRRTTGPTTIRQVPAGERGFLMAFRKCASSGAQEDFYAKLFWKNAHGSQALLGALVKQSADPQGKVTHALATAADDSGSVTNRKTAPGGLTFDDSDKAVPGTNLEAGAAIGVWLRLRLAANDPAFRDSYTSEIAGTSV
jgi:hypothetical protein